jgi:hypothetical protein
MAGTTRESVILTQEQLDELASVFKSVRSYVKVNFTPVSIYGEHFYVKRRVSLVLLYVIRDSLRSFISD